jgi:hypothetical protein
MHSFGVIEVMLEYTRSPQQILRNLDYARSLKSEMYFFGLSIGWPYPIQHSLLQSNPY